MNKSWVVSMVAVLVLICSGCGINPSSTIPDKIPAGVYVGSASCTDSSGAETTLQGLLRVDENGWPLTADGEVLVLGTPLELPPGGGFEIEGELTALDVDGPKIVETWQYTATTTAVEGGEFTYVLVKTSRLESIGNVTMIMTQIGSGFDPSLNQYVTWNQECSGTLSR